jgi:TolA-binding protein
MGKKILMVTVIFSLCSWSALAQEQEKNQGAGIAAWLKGIQQKISQIMPKKAVPVSTGVAGVRGAKEDSQVKLYWKGKKGEESVSQEELTEFKEGIDLAEKGDKPGAIHELEEFMKKYPDSALVPDAKKTLDLVKAEPKPEKMTEEKSGQKPEEMKEENKEEKKQ